MRVAVSGTHGIGKSTLIDAFVRRHDDYVAEPEAYEALQDVYGEAFAAEPSAEEFFRQLEYHVERLREYRAGDRVVFERSPADYLAYLLALKDLSRNTANAQLTERALEPAREGMAMLDLIVYLPGDGGGPEMEDPELGRAVDARLEGILIHDELCVFERRRPVVVEAAGTTAQRLRVLEAALG
jgi:AAA domain